MVIMILSEKFMHVISVGIPPTLPVACFDGAGKGSSLASEEVAMAATWTMSEFSEQPMLCQWFRK
jgi:hypothetical protein